MCNIYTHYCIYIHNLYIICKKNLKSQKEHKPSGLSILKILIYLYIFLYNMYLY